jgi:1-aminocyclopropane-1-carboxylate deaminase/D-cysteine desulfhydrase-like pyridoxal-dependent ACC family enzyme
MYIPDRLANHPRAGLIQIPAIIHKLPRLSSKLGLEIYVLRDDLTGFGIGGNKTRKADFLFGDAIAHGATTLVTIKATSFSRNAAAAASACGLEFHVVLPGAESDQNPLSQDLFAKWGSRIHYEVAGEAALVHHLEDVVASRTASDQSRLVRDLAESTARLLGVPVDPESIIADDRFVGPGYAEASEEGKEAAEIFAEQEGILLDPVYTGKAAAALLQYARTGSFGDGPVLFIHTGGNAGLYY